MRHAKSGCYVNTSGGGELVVAIVIAVGFGVGVPEVIIVTEMDIIQDEIREWADRNFAEPRGLEIVPLIEPVMGIQEEAGELAHHWLKREQGIRGTPEFHNEQMIDALGDLGVYMMNACSIMGVSLEDTIRKTWEHVKTRDWVTDSERGVTATEHKRG